jgi:hypothetical protein
MPVEDSQAFQNTVMWILGLLGPAIAIFEGAWLWANRRNAKRQQFIVASIHQLALSRTTGWQSLLDTLFWEEMDPKLRVAIARVIVLARDDFQDVVTQCAALENAIDSGSSAIAAIQKKVTAQAVEHGKLIEANIENLELQNKHQAVFRQRDTNQAGIDRIAEPDRRHSEGPSTPPAEPNNA